MPYSLTINIEPMGKPRMTQRDRWKKRPVVERYHDFCDAVREQAGDGFELPAEVNLTFYITMPPSWSKKTRLEMIGAPHQAKPDIDNLAKGFMDAFKDETGKTAEDKHVYSLYAEKRWSEVGYIDVEWGEGLRGPV